MSAKKIGLSLSGGGYRATAFHLGTLKKLKELNILDEVEVISTISGGSLTGAYYLLHKDDFENFEASLESCLQKNVINQIKFSWQIILMFLGIIALLIGLSFVFDHQNKLLLWSIGLISIVAIILRFQFFFLPFTKLKIKAYKKIFFGEKTLSDLPDKPRIAINATNLETGTLWTFSKTKVSDSSYQYPKDGGKPIIFLPNDFPISLAVASSTAVPVPFQPVE
jgi:NTE family protein